MQHIATSNGSMDWHKYPKSRTSIRIGQPETLDSIKCHTFPGFRDKSLGVASCAWVVSRLKRLVPGRRLLKRSGSCVGLRLAGVARLHLEPLFSVYAWNMPGIYHAYVVLPHMPGICLLNPWLYHVYPSDWIYMVYPWIFLDIPCISIKYVQCIPMDIHGISLDVYTWYIRGILRYIHGYS